LDLDNFKELNDTFGHTFGDKVLCAISERLLTLAGPQDMVARLGGDEFALVLVGDCRERTEAVCQRIRSIAQAPLNVMSRQIDVRATVGVAFYPELANTVDELFANADLALYRAKKSAVGETIIFQKEYRAEFEAKLSLEAELQRAFRQEEFELFYQPQVDLQTSKIIGAEALIRWRHPVRGMVSPSEFLPVLNQTPLAFEVGNWVMRTACDQAAAWCQAGREMRVGVNLSPAQVQSADLQHSVATALTSSGLRPGLLELEVTEDNLLANESQALSVIAGLRALGVRTAFDDFGTGYASLSHLKKLRLDVIKIDRSFVMELNASAADRAIVEAIVSLGQQLGLSIIAEGIEDEIAADILRQLGCQEAQGYYFGRPMPASDFSALLGVAPKTKQTKSAA
jgi:diguanylate cyclase (GGDEF)-like protein